MAVLSWGKPTVEIALLGADGTPGEWKKMPTIVKDTAKLTPTKGNKSEAEGEGGELVDARYEKNKQLFECEVFVKKGDTKPIEDDDGVVSEQYAVRLTPEDAETEGWLMDKAQVGCEETWTSADGKRWKYSFDALKPKEGKILKPYYASGLEVTPAKLYFNGDADSTGKTVTVTSTATPTATSSESWCTTSVAGQVVTVMVAENTDGDAREAIVTIKADGKTSRVTVTQIPA
jgi:hypothetical protein